MEILINETWTDRRLPMQELHRLIERRQRVMKESKSDATIATAITALRSIRAATRKAAIKGGKKRGK